MDVNNADGCVRNAEDAILDVSKKVKDRVYEAYAKGYLDGEKKAEEVWTFISNTVTPNTPEREWDTDTDKSIGYGNVWEKFDTYAEAKAAFEAWQKRCQWEPMVGDVVRLKSIISAPGVIVGVLTEDNKVPVWWMGGGQEYLSVECLEPTGHHVDLSNIFKVLEEVEHE